jgi:Flp pilus assembly protein TadD
MRNVFSPTSVRQKISKRERNRNFYTIISVIQRKPMGQRRIFSTIINLFFAIVCILALSHAHAQIPDIVLSQKNTTVTIYVHDKDGDLITSGSGFIVDQDGFVATNCNVIIQWLKQVPHTLTVETYEGSLLPIVDLISSKCVNNLALIKVRTRDPLPAVSMAKVYSPKQGETIFALTPSPGFEPMASDGVIKAVPLKRKLLQISIPVLPEESGSPVFNRDGVAIAALTFLPKKSKSKYFAVPLQTIGKQLTAYKKRSYELAKKVPPGIPPPSTRPPSVKKERPLNARDYFLRGCSYHELEMYSEAVKSYQKAISLNPDFTEAFVNLGVAYYQLGKYSKAIDAYKKALLLSPHSPSLYNKLGSIYILHGSYTKALDSFRKASEIEPQNPVSHYNLGIAYYLNGDRNAAFKEYAILKELDKDRAKSLLDLIY